MMRSIASFLLLSAVLVLTSCSHKSAESADDLAAARNAANAGAGNAADESRDLKTVYFAYDEAVLSPEARDALKANAKWLKAHSAATLQIEGHCDERGTTEYNLALGERRAAEVKKYLENMGVDASRLSIISYGNQRPVDPGHDESAWAHNRRAVASVAPQVSQAN